MKAIPALCMTLLVCICFVEEIQAAVGHSLRGGTAQPNSLETNNDEDLPRLLLQDLAPQQNQNPTEANHPLTWIYDIFNGKGSNLVGQDDETTMASYIIEFDDSVQDIEGAAAIIANWLGRRPGHVFKQLMHGFSIANVPKSIVPKIKRIEGVKSVQLDEEVSLDGELVQLLQDEDGPTSRRLQERQEIPWGITHTNGGKTYNGTNVVFVIDTGVDVNHPDLNVHPTLCFSLAGDSCNDDNGHGTHVAGTIAAIDNGIGVVGIAAGATIVPVKVVDAQGKGSMGGLLQGIEWVTENANVGDVVNISLGGKINQSVDDAILRAADKGLLIALSAGNDSSLASERSPSRTNHQNIFTIAATTKQDTLAYFSNVGKPPIDWAAPGVDILSTFKNGRYATMQGTSMSTPHAAGALLLGGRPNNRKRRDKKSTAVAMDANGNRYKIVVL